MASVARAIEQAAVEKVDASLWWEPHSDFLRDLEACLASSSSSPSSSSSSFPYATPGQSIAPPYPPLQALTERFLAKQKWLLEMLTQFKAPSASSRDALKLSKVSIGNNVVHIQPELHDLTMEMSKHLDLDEVQTYLLVSRCTVVRPCFQLGDEFISQVTMNYYLERQCLLKCTRLLLTFQMVEEESLPSSYAELMSEEVKKLLENGIEDKALSNLKQLSSFTHVYRLAPEYAGMCVEETILEQSLLMDILFLLYYEPLCVCDSRSWKELLLFFQESIFEGRTREMLAITAEAKKYIQHVRHQAMLILIETLDLDSLLLMIHDETAFSVGKHGFALKELQQLDLIITGLDPAYAAEYAPLLLGWATFLCLVSSLPSDGNMDSLDFEHAAYAHQAYKNGAYGFLLSVLQTDSFKEQDAPISGYKSVVKSLVAACLAAYDFSNQVEQEACNLLVDILCYIYEGQEVLASELWDRDGVLDGPIRSLLFVLRDCFPHQLLPLVRLLSSLCEGSWSAECVYNFLCTMGEITSLLNYSEHPSVPDTKNPVQTSRILQLPNAPGVLIPAGTLGHIIKMVENNHVLVKWKCTHSALVILLACLLQWPLNENQKEEILAILELLNRMLNSNKMLVPSLLGIENSKAVLLSRAAECVDKSLRFDTIGIICSLVEKFSSDPGCDAGIASCLGILSSLADYCPVEVVAGVSSTDLFYPAKKDFNFSDHCSLLSSYAHSRISTHHHSAGWHILVLSALKMGKVILKRGIQAELILFLTKQVMHKFLVDHMNWKYKHRHERWEVATEIFDYLVTLLGRPSWNNNQLRKVVLETLLNDANMQDVLLQVLSIDDQSLEDLRLNRVVNPKEVEWIELAICAVLKLLNSVLLERTQGEYPKTSLLELSLFKKRESSMPVVTAIMSFMCYFRDAGLQVNSVRLLRNLCITAQQAQPHPFNIASYISIQLKQRLRSSLSLLISEDFAFKNSDLFLAVFDFLSSAAKFQPALVELLLFPSEYNNNRQIPSGKADSTNSESDFVADISFSISTKSACLNAIVKVLRRSAVLLKSNPYILSRVLLFLSSLWQGGIEYFPLIEALNSEGKLWDWIGSCLSSPSRSAKPQDLLQSNVAVCHMEDDFLNTSTLHQRFASAMQHYCEAYSFLIAANDLFLQQQLLYRESTESYSMAVPLKGEENHGANFQGTRSEISKEVTCKDSCSSVSHQWVQSLKLQSVIQSTVYSKIDRDFLREAKAEAQALVIGLMGKILSGDTRGMNVSFVQHLSEASTKILEHPAFMELLSYYSSSGFGYGEQVQTMLLVDLYYHLHGQVRGGRQVPDGPFQRIAQFLVSIELDRLLLPEFHLHLKSLHAVHGHCLMFDTSALRHSLGLDLWQKNGVLPVSEVESTLRSLSHANIIASLQDAKLCGLEAFSDFLTISIFNNQRSPKGLDPELLKSSLQECVLSICDVLNKEMIIMGPPMPEDHLVMKFLSLQTQLLLILLQWLRDQLLCAPEWLNVCAKLIRTSNVCLKHALETNESLHRENLLVKNLLAAFLLVLELMHSEKQTNRSQENGIHSAGDQGLGDAFVDITLAGLEFLPLLCNAADLRAHAFLSLAAINLLIDRFLASSTWLPIIHKHFPMKRVLARLSLSDIDLATALLQLCLTFSRAKKSAEMLHSACFVDHFLVFCRQLHEESSFLATDTAGPFSSKHKRQRQHILWGLGVAVITSMVHVLAKNDIDHSAVDSAFKFFRAESYRILGNLSTPYSTNDLEGKKRPRLQHPRTTLASLHEAQHVIALICELIHYHVLWKTVLQDAGCTIREMAIHLLAYIGREGLARPTSYTSSGLDLIVTCPPQNKEEVIAQGRPPIIGSSSAWFAVAARGSVSNSKKAILKSSSYGSPSSPLRKSSSSTSAVFVFTDAEADLPVAYSEYSDKVALCVYSIASLLLSFMCGEVQQAIHDFGGSSLDIGSFPELPAPEILHGLQDQVIAVLMEIFSANKSKLVKEMQQVCLLLLGILEKTLYLEACLIRVYGFSPLSLRADDFSKEYKALIIAAQAYQYTETVLSSMKQIVSLAYPGIM